MSRMMNAGFVALLMIGLVGCDGGQDIVSPNLQQDMSAMETSATTDCPTFAETYTGIVQQIVGGCPPEEFSNYGQLQSCRVHAVNELMDQLPDCYTSSERLALKKAVMAAVGLDQDLGHRNRSKLDYTQE